MIMFAHNGINHSTSQEAAAHILFDAIRITAFLVIGAAIVALVAYAVRKLETIKISEIKKEK